MPCVRCASTPRGGERARYQPGLQRVCAHAQAGRGGSRPTCCKSYQREHRPPAASNINIQKKKRRKNNERNKGVRAQIRKGSRLKMSSFCATDSKTSPSPIPIFLLVLFFSPFSFFHFFLFSTTTSSVALLLLLGLSCSGLTTDALTPCARRISAKYCISKNLGKAK